MPVTEIEIYVSRMGQLIRKARQARGLTQRQLERAMGYETPTVTSYECGRIEPRLTTLLGFAMHLGCDVRDFIPSSLSLEEDPVLPAPDESDEEKDDEESGPGGSAV